MGNGVKTILFLLTPIFELFRAIGFIVDKAYKLAFGWWLDEHLTKRKEAKFAHDIHHALSFLFLEYEAKFIPNDRHYPQAFDYVVVTIEVRNLRFRFIRGRGDLRVDVSPIFSNDWHELSLVLSTIEITKNEIPKEHNYIFLSDISSLLSSRFELFNEQFSMNKYSELKNRLSEIDAYHRVVTKQVQASLNIRSSL